MITDIHPRTESQKQAFLNEFKGNLFEFLVGSHLAREHHLEADFLSSLDGNLKKQLLSYETWMRQKGPDLLFKLPSLAYELKEKLKKHLPQTVDRIKLVGKVAGNSSYMKESDLLVWADGQEHPVSIKLCKNKAFVNTKSGGIRSFLTKYFGHFENAIFLQEKLNYRLEECFYQMGSDLHEIANLPFDGKFTQKWREKIGTELPGELPVEMRDRVLKFYQEMIATLYDAILFLSENDPEQFKKDIFPLLGFGRKNLIKATCFHGYDRVKKSSYGLKEIDIQTYNDLEKKIKKIKIGCLKKELSSFEINLANQILQIRVKPMNKFTVSGLKVNCSVKKDFSN